MSAKAELIWNIRCSALNFAEYSFFTRLICRLLARTSSVPRLIICNSAAGRADHVRFGYRPDRWRIIPNGFDVQRFIPSPSRAAAFRRELNVTSEVLIGLPGRWDPMKDHRTFVEAAALLAKERPDIRFVLLGRGVDRTNAELVSLLHAMGLNDRFFLLGERADMEVIMAGLDIMTLCSAYGEGFPNVIGEALSCGTPCVATDVGDAALIVDGHGCVIQPRDPQQLAQAWRSTLDRTAAEKSMIASRARQHIIDRYSLPAIARMYEETYREISG